MGKNRHRLCYNIVLTCEDYRLHQQPDGSNPVAQFIQDTVQGSCFLITRAGGVLDLNLEEFNQSVKKDIKIGINHGVKNIYPLNHQDCGAYRHFKFKTQEEEFKKHKEDLWRATELICTWFPSVIVEPYFARLINYGHNNWAISQAILNLNL